MYNEAISGHRLARDTGILLFVLSSVTGFFLLRYASSAQSLPLGLSWIPLLLPFLFGLTLSISRLDLRVDKSSIKIRLVPFTSFEIPLEDIQTVEPATEVALSQNWNKTIPCDRSYAAPFQKGAGVKITTVGGLTYLIRSNQPVELQHAIQVNQSDEPSL